MKKTKIFIVTTLIVILIVGISACSNSSDDTKSTNNKSEFDIVSEGSDDLTPTDNRGSNQSEERINENRSPEVEDVLEQASGTEKKASKDMTNTEGNEEIKSDNNQDQKDNKIHDDEDPRKIPNKELSVFIANYHEILNKITSNEKYESIDWNNMKSTKEGMLNEIEQFLNHQDSYPPSMELDLERIIQLAKISLENHDPTAVIYIHRILHDLDVEYNKYTPNNKYGFSNYDGGGENQLTISDYIEEHKK